MNDPPTQVTENNKDYNKYTWDCTVDSVDLECDFKVELCNGVELKDEEFCCRDADVTNPNAKNDANGIFGDDELLCQSNNGSNKCFARRLCVDVATMQEEHGEDGDAGVECMYELKCATAIVHSCNMNRPNSNCQDECLTGVLPPAQCPW